MLIMKTFYDDDGNYADMPLTEILNRMTDDWIDNEITGVNISELRDACKHLEAEVERLKKRAEFMGHCNSCALHPSKTSSDTTRCTCGLDELLAEE